VAEGLRRDDRGDGIDRVYGFLCTAAGHCGFDVMLVDPRQTKHDRVVQERRAGLPMDPAAAQHGLLTASFRLRMRSWSGRLSTAAEMLIRTRPARAAHAEGAEEMNVKLTRWCQTSWVRPGMKIFKDIVRGERDP